MKARRVPETTGSLRGHGVTLRYSRWQGGGAPIVVLHGGSQTRHAGRELRAPRRPGYDVTALDLRGHGESSGRRTRVRARALHRRRSRCCRSSASRAWRCSASRSAGWVSLT